MTNRDLFHATMRRENGDMLLHVEQAFNVPYKVWKKDGLPDDIAAAWMPSLSVNKSLYDHFNVTGFMWDMRFDQFCVPKHPERILCDDGKTVTYVNTLGNTMVGISQQIQTERDDGAMIGSPPHEVDFLIKTPNDYMDNRFRFVGNISERYDAGNLTAESDAYRTQPDYITAVWVHGPFAFLREILGTENAMVLPYEEPEMIRLMLKDHLETAMAAAEFVIKSIQPDITYIWEDCCGGSGPFIAPSMFDEMFADWYRAWKDYTFSMGVPWTVLDTDGDPLPLVRRWYDNGIDLILPWEVNGVDMLSFAEDFPQYNMLGGIYKHMFEPGDIAQTGRFKSADVHQSIDDELRRVVKPMRKRGGYFPSLDHAAFWGVTYDGYRYYSDQLREKYGKANTVQRHSCCTALYQRYY